MTPEFDESYLFVIFTIKFVRRFVVITLQFATIFAVHPDWRNAGRIPLLQNTDGTPDILMLDGWRG